MSSKFARKVDDKNLELNNYEYSMIKISVQREREDLASIFHMCSEN